MTVPEVFVVREANVLYEAIAARLITRVVDWQAARGRARVLVGGDAPSLAVLQAVVASPARDAVDYERLEIWFANDTWADRDDPTRAAGAAEQILLDADLSLTALHPIPGPGHSRDATDAAEQYATSLAAARGLDDHGAMPGFDVLLIGIGPGGAVAGIVPEQPATHDDRTVTVVTTTADRAPRVTLTVPALGAADEAWLIGTGAEVSAAVHLALSGAGSVQVPVAGVRGRQRTLLLLDDAAARRLPASLRRLASP